MLFNNASVAGVVSARLSIPVKVVVSVMTVVLVMTYWNAASGLLGCDETIVVFPEVNVGALAVSV